MTTLFARAWHRAGTLVHFIIQRRSTVTTEPTPTAIPDLSGLPVSAIRVLVLGEPLDPESAGQTPVPPQRSLEQATELLRRLDVELQRVDEAIALSESAAQEAFSQEDLTGIGAVWAARAEFERRREALVPLRAEAERQWRELVTPVALGLEASAREQLQGLQEQWLTSWTNLGARLHELATGAYEAVDAVYKVQMRLAETRNRWAAEVQAAHARTPGYSPPLAMPEWALPPAPLLQIAQQLNTTVRRTQQLIDRMQALAPAGTPLTADALAAAVEPPPADLAPVAEITDAAGAAA